MKEYLAKLILGKDVRKELANAEKEMRSTKDKLNGISRDVAALETETCILDRCINTKERELSDLQEEKRDIDELLSQVGIEENEDALTILRRRKIEKNGMLDTLKHDLSSLESQRDQLKTKIPVLQQEKQVLQREVNALKAQVEEKERIDSQLVNKLEQRKGIRGHLNDLKEQWPQKQNDFETHIEEADREELLRLPHELKDYETLITNAINTPIV